MTITLPTTPINWTRDWKSRSAFWTGSTGNVDYCERFAFGISKVQATRFRRRTTSYAYVVHAQIRPSLTVVLGKFPTFQAAKDAALAFTGTHNVYGKA